MAALEIHLHVPATGRLSTSRDTELSLALSSSPARMLQNSRRMVTSKSSLKLRTDQDTWMGQAMPLECRYMQLYLDLLRRGTSFATPLVTEASQPMATYKKT